MSAEKSVVLDTIIEFVMEQLAYRVRKFELKRLVSLLVYGPRPDNENVPLKDVDQSVFENVCSKARELMISRIAVAQKDALIDSISFYESVLAKPHVEERTKIRAQENLDKLHQLVQIRVKMDGIGSGDDDATAKAIREKLIERFTSEKGSSNE
jgi:hypothetical protein